MTGLAAPAPPAFITAEALVTGPNIRVKRTRQGLVLYNPHDAYIGRSFDLYGEFSHEETKVFARIVKPGMTVVDVGANIGAHTLSFAQAVGPSGLVIAFEPQRVLYQMLCANLALNEITHVRALQMGAGRENGQAFIPAIDYANPGNFGGIALAAHGFGEQVMVVPIDQIGLAQCHFIKIDVEGMEEEAILGAQETISRHRPILYVENDRRDKSPSLIRRLLDMSYMLHWHIPPLFSADNIYGNPHNIFPNIISLNLLCVPREMSPDVARANEIVDPDDWPHDLPSSGAGAPAAESLADAQTAGIASTPSRAPRKPSPPVPPAAPGNPVTPRSPAAEVMRALDLEQRGRLDEAAQVYAAILQADPQNPHALHRQAVLAAQQGYHAQALALIESAVKVTPPASPTYAQLLQDYGLILHNLRRFEDAAATFDRALILSPRMFSALFNRGNTLLELKRHKQALSSFDKALVVEPGHVGCLGNRGVALSGLGRFDDAIASFEQALSLQPDGLDLLKGCAHALTQVGRHAEAAAFCDRALAISSDDADAHFSKAANLLSLGAFPEGWREYEWRWWIKYAEGARPTFAQPQWTGEAALGSKTVLVHAEQGLGDTIMFIRYAALLAARGARVVARVQAPLKSLLTSVEGLSDVVAPADPLPPFDLHAPLLSLPHAFATDLDSIPAQVPYIGASPERVATWRARLPPGKPLRVGLVWSGGRGSPSGTNRSIALRQLKRFLTDERILFISLVHELRDEDAPVLPTCSNILHVGGELRDFADTAAVVSLLDLVISVDTAVAHLAGAMAKPVWFLLLFSPDFRWMVGREDSPWYPTARLFRQPRLGDWDSVLARVKQELAGWDAAAQERTRLAER